MEPHIRSGERHRQEFFRLRGYPNWRSEGNEEDLAIYLRQDTGYLPLLLMALLSQLQQLLPCFPFPAKNRNRTTQDLEKGLPAGLLGKDTCTSSEDGAGLRPAADMEPTSKTVVYESHSGFGAEVNRRRTDAPQVESLRTMALCPKRWPWATGIAMPRLGLAHLLSSLCLCSASSYKSVSGVDERTHLLEARCTETAVNPCQIEAYASLNQRPVMDSVESQNISRLDGGHFLVAIVDESGKQYDHNHLKPSTSITTTTTTTMTKSNANALTAAHRQPLRPVDGNVIMRTLPQSPFLYDKQNASPRPRMSGGSLLTPRVVGVPPSSTDLIRKFGLDLPELPIMDQHWSPPCPESNNTSRAIAAIMDETLYFPFRLIPFAVLRDAAAHGNYTDLFMDLLNGITHVYNELCKLFIKYPKQRRLYEEAKTVFLSRI